MDATSRAVEVLKTYFDKHGEFVGSKDELADRVDLQIHHVTWALSRVRSPEFIDANGWTIPYVPKGPGAWLHTWTVAQTAERTPQLEKGCKIKRAETETHLRNCAGQLDLLVKLTDGRSEVGRDARLMARHVRRALEDIDQMRGIPA